jgi:hypothetical protein
MKEERELVSRMEVKGPELPSSISSSIFVIGLPPVSVFRFLKLTAI